MCGRVCRGSILCRCFSLKQIPGSADIHITWHSALICPSFIRIQKDIRRVHITETSMYCYPSPLKVCAPWNISVPHATVALGEHAVVWHPGPIAWQIGRFWMNNYRQQNVRQREGDRRQIDIEDAQPFVMLFCRQTNLGPLFQKVNCAQIHK